MGSMNILLYLSAVLVLSHSHNLPIHASACIVLVGWGMFGIVEKAPSRYADLNQMSNEQVNEMVRRQL